MSMNIMHAKDSTGQVRSVLCSSTGKLDVVCATTLSEATSSIVVYGNDGSANRVIKTDASGKVEVVPPNLAQSSDSVAVYGSDGTTARQLKTDTTGKLEVLVKEQPAKSASSASLWTAQSISSGSSLSTSGVDVSAHRHITIYGTTTNTSERVNVEVSDDNVAYFGLSTVLMMPDANGAFGVVLQNLSAPYVRLTKANNGTGSETITAKYSIMA